MMRGYATSPAQNYALGAIAIPAVAATIRITRRSGANQAPPAPGSMDEPGDDGIVAGRPAAPVV